MHKHTAHRSREKRQLGIFGRVLNKKSRSRRGGIQRQRTIERERRKCIRIEPYMVVVVVAFILGCCTIQTSFFRSLLVVFPSLHNVCFIFFSRFLLSMSDFRRFSEHSILFIVFTSVHLFILVVFVLDSAWVFVSRENENLDYDHCMANLFPS